MLMEFLDLKTIAALGALLLALLLVFRQTAYRRKCEQLESEVQDLRRRIVFANSELRELRHKQKGKALFEENLSKADLTTRMQSPLLSARYGSEDPTAPERYRYALSLIEKGLTAKEIGSILELSPEEAKQLINLAKITSTSQ